MKPTNSNPTETYTCLTCKKTLYNGEGKTTCKAACESKIANNEEALIDPYKEKKKSNHHSGLHILKVLVIAFFVGWGGNSYAQDTICISKDRLARIADTLARTTQFEGAFLQCDTLLSQQYEMTLLKHEQMIEYKRMHQFETVKTAQLSKEVTAWKEAAEESNKELIKTNKKLNKARRARKGWMGASIGAVGALGAGLTTVILLLK